MNIEFHYYTTYIIANLAGFSKPDCYRIAYSSQFVDDNCQVKAIAHNFGYYQNSISHSYNPLIGMNSLYKIYVCHHFLPGDDNYHSKLLTTPNSKMANIVLDWALQERCPYKIGIALHAFADTWAHQNFTGTLNTINSRDDFHINLIPNLGHADFLDAPDRFNHIWLDDRINFKGEVDNSKRNIEAAIAIYTRLIKHNCKTSSNIKRLQEFLSFEFAFYLDSCDCYDFFNNIHQEALAQHWRIPKYDSDEWYCKAEKSTDLEHTDWYKFQEAVKEYQSFVWSTILKKHRKNGAFSQLFGDETSIKQTN